MTPEEYQRLKEEEKAHLRKLKELKQAVRFLERQKKISSELEQMSRASEDALQQQTDAVERLALETALQEARLDIALEGADPDPAPSDEALEQELRAARAHALVEQMKHSMSDSDETESEDESVESGEAGSVTHHSPRRTGVGDSESPPATSQPRPEKTIGRM